MRRGALLAALASLACVHCARAAVAEHDAASLLTALANASVVVTFYTRWRVCTLRRDASQRGGRASAPSHRVVAARADLVRLFGRRCGLCSAFEPEFERLAAAFDDAPTAGDTPLLFGRVDVDAHRPVAKSFGVRNVPFVTLLRHGAWFTWDVAAGEPVPTPATRFEGALAADAVAAWLNNGTGRSVRLPVHVEELSPAKLREAQQDTASDVLVEFYGAGCSRCQEFEDEYKKVGARFAQSALQRVARVDVHAHRHLVAEHNLTGLPSFVLFPRGSAHRERGLRFRGAHSSRALFEFVASPAVYLLEADVAARGADCMHDLLARGVVPAAGEELNNSQRAQAVVDAAHRAATAHNWADALEALLCLAATPALRRTGIGSSPALWHLLDNAKSSYEREALQRIGLAQEDAQEVEPAAIEAAAGSADEAPDAWEQFHAMAAERAAALGERGVLADEL